MADVFLQQLPIWLVAILGFIIVGAQIISALKTWKSAKKEREDEIIKKNQEEEAEKEDLKALHAKMDLLLERQDNFDTRLNESDTKIDRLIESDKHDIKAWIVAQHQYFVVELGWIDGYSLETIERRYEDYEAEGGNHYIHSLMQRLRTLPMEPPETK